MKFYLDTEYVNGNYYMCDIFDISLLSDATGNTFHVYIKQDIPLPESVTKLTKITNEMLEENGVEDFAEAIDSMTNFIKNEIQELVNDNVNVDDVIVTFIAHGGFENDFPFLINNCRKNNIVLDNLFNRAFYQDSMISFKSHYETPRLSSLARMCNLENKYQRHSSFGDVRLLKELCDRHTPYISMFTKTYKQLCIEIYEKMPIDFEEIRMMKRVSLTSITRFTDMVRTRTKSNNSKSSLRNNNLDKICKYFMNRKKF